MKQILANIISILTKQEKRKFNILVVLNMLVSIADIFSLVLILFVIKLYTQQDSNDDFSFLPKIFLDKQSFVAAIFFLIFFLIKNIAGYIVYSQQYRFVYNVASCLSATNISNYLDGNYTDYVHVDSAVHIRKISQQPIEFAHYVLAGAQQIIAEIILVSLAIITVFLFNTKLFLLLAAMLLPAVFILSYFTKRKLKNIRADIEITNENTLQYLKEALSGFVESAIYGKRNFFAKRYADNQKKLNSYLAELHVTQAVPSRFFESFAVLALFILIVVNKLSGNSGTADIIAIGAFMAAAYKIIPGIGKIINISGQIKTFEYTIRDLTNNVIEKKEKKESDCDSSIRSIIIKDLFFKYGYHTIFKNFNLSLESTDFIGISGNSGKGKTTLVNLLLGFLDCDEKSILINNKPVDKDEKFFYHKKISYVKQQPFLIYDSIEKNITLDESVVDETKLKEVIKASGLDTLLAQFPEESKKLITENGKNISGGQRQRIAIARALYKNTDLIILDEPFSELDAASEQDLLKYFKQLSAEGKIIMLITHNQNNLAFCNKIISLDD